MSSCSWREFLDDFIGELGHIRHTFHEVRKFHMGPNEPNHEGKKILALHMRNMERRLGAMKRAGVGRDSSNEQVQVQQISQLHSRVHEQENVIMEKEKKYEELQARLSKEMSAKLRLNNPNVINLSDPMNAPRVSVMLNGIYDEEWTRAFDALETNHQREEYDAIMKLKAELMSCYEFCREEAESQLKHLCRAMFGSECDSPEEEKSEEMKKFTQTIVENRKALAASSLTHLLEEYRPRAQLRTELETYGQDKRGPISDYIVKCIEICWYMAVSDPPLVLQDQPQGGQPLDPRSFQPYQTSGNHINYVVWPAVLLANNGGLVHKGVAEFTKEKPRTQYPNVQKS